MFSVSGSFWPFSNNSRLFQDFRILTKMSEDVRRLPKISKKKSENFRLHFCRYIHMGKDYLLQFTDANFFQGEKFLKFTLINVLTEYLFIIKIGCNVECSTKVTD